MKTFIQAAAFSEIAFPDYAHVHVTFTGYYEDGSYYVGKSVDNLYLDGLRLTCQMDKDQKTPYAMSAEYKNIAVNRGNIETIQKTLTKINRALDKYRASYGEIKTFGLFCTVVCDALKVRTYIVERQNSTRQHFLYNVDTIVHTAGAKI